LLGDFVVMLGGSIPGMIYPLSVTCVLTVMLQPYLPHISLDSTHALASILPVFMAYGGRFGEQFFSWLILPISEKINFSESNQWLGWNLS